MNRKHIASSIIISMCFASTVTACSNQATLESSAVESLETEVEATTETSIEETEATEETPFEPYVHSADGYFNLFEEGNATEIKTQVRGTCWVTGAATSMESSYLWRNGEIISIDPVDLLNEVFSDEKPEGWFVPVAYQLDIGGWNWQIVETLSNGWSDYILMDATMYDNVYRDIETIQNAIRENGAMCVGINDTNGDTYLRFFEDYFTFNAPEYIAEIFDHEVSIVGWDDNFPREYFAYEASQDGAWLCQNTHGGSWGNGGFYWVSYDMPLESPTIMIISDEYDHVLSYDWGNEDILDIGTETITTANVFHESGVLRAVGTDTTCLNQGIHIAICDASMQNVIYEQDAFFPVNGYHTVILDEPVEVSDYSIVITYDTSAPVEGEAYVFESYEFRANCNEGESFVQVDGEWIDMASENIEEILGIDFIPNNCCIKAIY